MELTKKQIETLKRNNEEAKFITREAIKEALYILMEKKEFSEIKISEIIIKSGVSRSAFYRNYKTKDEILQDTVNELHDLFLSKSGNSLQENWELIFSILRENKKKLDLIIKAGLEHYLLHKFNENLDMKSGDDFKEAMNNGLIMNVLIYWAKCGMKDTDTEAAEKIVQAYQQMYKDLKSYSK